MKKIIIVFSVIVSIMAIGYFCLSFLVPKEQPPVNEEMIQSVTTTVRNEPTEYVQRELSIAGPSGKIVAELYLPQSSQPVPLAIYAHELGMTREAGEMYAEFFARQGIATVVFDFAGGSPSSQSEGSTENMTIRSEVSDLQAVIAYAQQLQEINTNHIHLIGASQGGLVAALTAAERPTQIRSLTLLYPALLIPEVIRQLTQVTGGDRYQVTNLFGVYPISRAYVDDAFDIQVYETIGAYQGPVLLVHGTQDPIVDVSYSRQALGTYSNARLEVVEGAGHSFTDTYFEEVSQKILGFLKENNE